jgi:hypothetical protein
MLYIYGVTRAGREQPSDTGLGEPPAPVRLVESGPVAAVVSELPDDFVVQDDDARAHLQVLIGLLDGGPILPVRMGTVAPGEDAVRAEVLDTARAELVSRLDSVDGLVELHVDADDDEAASIAAVARTARLQLSTGGDLSARIQLGEEVAQLLVEHRQQLAEQIVAELRPLAVQDTPRSTLRSAEDPMLRWAFLVPRDDLARFDGAIVEVRQQNPELAIRYAGPLPPSHFVDWQPAAAETEPSDSFHASGAWGFEA